MDAHKHQFTKITGERIKRINNPDYKGAAGDKTILSYECKCGMKSAFDYGGTNSMRERWQSLMAQKLSD